MGEGEAGVWRWAGLAPGQGWRVAVASLCGNPAFAPPEPGIDDASFRSGPVLGRQSAAALLVGKEENIAREGQRLHMQR